MPAYTYPFTFSLFNTMHNTDRSFLITASIFVAVLLTLILGLILIYVPMIVISFLSEKTYYAAEAHNWGALIGIIGAILSVLLGRTLMRIISLNRSIIRCEKENQPEKALKHLQNLKTIVIIFGSIPLVILAWWFLMTWR